MYLCDIVWLQKSQSLEGEGHVLRHCADLIRREANRVRVMPGTELADIKNLKYITAPSHTAVHYQNYISIYKHPMNICIPRLILAAIRAKVFPATFGGMISFDAAKASNPRKFLCENRIFHQFTKCSPSKVSRYTVIVKITGAWRASND